MSTYTEVVRNASISAIVNLIRVFYKEQICLSVYKVYRITLGRRALSRLIRIVGRSATVTLFCELGDMESADNNTGSLM